MDIKKTWLFCRPIAHRGLHNNEVPENSLKAFELAIEANYPIELDVRLSDDKDIVVFHDDKLSRMTQKDGYVLNTPSHELYQMPLIGKDKKPTDYKIPSLEDVLTLVNGRTPILIEFKNQHGGGILESKAIDMLRGYNGEYAVQSFNPYSMEHFKLNAFEIPRGQLSTFFKKNELHGIFKRAALKRLKLNKVSQPDFISYNAESLPNKWVSKANLPCIAWTVRSNADLERVRPYCDNIIFENFIPEIDVKE